MKTMFITGGDRGLGFALCELYLHQGEKVFAGRFMPDWKELDELKARYPNTLELIELDVSSDESVKRAAEMTEEKTDHIDILINVAGIDGKMVDIRDGYNYDRILRTINVNALGAMRMIECFLPLMDKGTDKKICNLSSEAGSIGSCWRDNEPDYCISKAALNMGMAIIYNRLSKEGYDIRMYHPGWMNTYMLGYKADDADLEAEDAAKIAAKHFAAPRVSDKLILESYDGSIIPW